MKGKVFEIQGDYDNALKCYKDARNFLGQTSDAALLDERIRVFNSIGWVYVCMGKYEKAMAISLEGLRVIQGSVEKIEHSMIFNTIGSANYYKGNIGQAIEFHTRSLRIRENLENIPEVITSLNNLGSAYLANAEYGEALEHFRRALASSEEIGDPFGKAMTLFNFARVHFAVGLYAKAEEHLRESLQLSRNYNMRVLNIQNYIVLGMILRDRKDNAKAEGNLFRALTAYSKQGNRWGLCTVILELLEVHRQRGNLAEAKSLAEEALRYATDLDIDYLRSQALLAKACNLRDCGEKDLGKILGILEEALAATSKVENPEVPGRILSEMAEVMVRMRRLQEARDHYREAEEKFRAVLDRLPKEFRPSYQDRHKDKFRRNDSVLLANEVPAPAAPGSPAQAAAAASSAAAEKDPLQRVNELMKALNGLPPLGEFLGLLLAHLMKVAAARSGFILERQGDRLRPLVSLGTEGRPPPAAGSIRLAAVQDALSRKAPVVGNGSAVFPFLSPRGAEGVVYLDGMRADSPPELLVLCQSFLSLVPLAFLTLPAVPPDQGTEAVEVATEEITEPGA